MLEQTSGVQVLSLEKVIEQDFKLEIVKLIPDPEAAIAKLKDKYLSLKVTDKASFKVADEARKDVKNVRVIGEKICDAQRESLEEKKKAWIKKKKEWSATVGEVEDYLEQQTDDWKLAEQKRKDEEARKIEEQRQLLDKRLLQRQQDLGKYSVLFADNTFMLGDVRYSYDQLREATDEMYLNEILPAFKAIFDQHEQERVQQEELKQQEAEKQRQEAEKLRQEQEQLEIEKQEMIQQRFELRMDRLKAVGLEETTADVAEMTNEQFQSYYQDVAERNQKERRRQEINSIFNDRFVELDGAKYNSATETIYAFSGDAMLSKTTLADMPDDEWDVLVKNHNQHAIEAKVEEERKQNEEKEKDDAFARREAQLKVIGLTPPAYMRFLRDMTDLEYADYYTKEFEAFEKKQHEEWLEQERIKKQQEEDRKKAELAEMTEGERWREWKKTVTAFILDVPTFDTKRYKAMAAVSKEKLEEILSLKAEKFPGK